ncbi:MAG: 4-hydroxythreonine-4-phosphate dehydrogenase PdxA [Acidobacteria bacterium]|nr:MAG: 4-hydroxythreonine-4-phosphate dehydrogenase PdxA [Acidobacteriota bacterium]
MLIGITMGDASGVGPEIILRAYRQGEIPAESVVFGDVSVLEYCSERLGYNLKLRRAEHARDVVPGSLNVLDFELLSRNETTPGQISRASGKAARQYVVSATRAALAREIDAIVTLPMNKEATRLTDPEFIGHTELIASLCRVPRVTMMLTLDHLATTYLTTHLSLQEAIRAVKKERIVELIQTTAATVARFVESPRIAVAGLNPHAGENGMFGQEEKTEIRPAVEAARELGLCVEGPFPPDTVFHLALRQKRYDAVVCMYHDQGHIALKLFDFEGGVNVTLGLPIIRTSVDHGTAFDIAYKGVASIRSFVAALRYAAKLHQGSEG